MRVPRAHLLAFVAVAWFARVALADTRQECIVASSVAQDLRQANKLVESRVQLLVCAREQCPTVIRRDCAEWLSEVDASLPTIVVSLRDAAGSDVVSARVVLDGAAFLESIDGKARAINPGVHKVRIEVAGTPPVEQELVIREGEKNRQVELRLPAPATQPTQPSVSSTTTTATEPVEHAPPMRQPPAGEPKPKQKEPASVKPTAPPKAETPRGSSKFVPLIVGGSAAPLLVGALGLEIWARSTYQDAKDELDDQARRDSLYDSANLRRYVAEGLAVAGGGCVAVAVWLYLRNRSDAADTGTTARITPVAGGHHAGLALIGTF